MSVESEILRIQNNIASAYTAVANKGGQVPSQPTSANLAGAVSSIQTGVTQEELDEALSAKQDTLIGQPGQVVGFNRMGLAYAVRGWSNPNMLDNWYFVDPVNQRGAGGTITAAGYFIDRWKLVSGSVQITSGGLVLNGTIVQILETDPIGALTATALTASGVMAASYDAAGKTFSVSATGQTIVAAKLEFGSVQTLVHQDVDGSWELNALPPNKALELAKCQRYQAVYGYQNESFNNSTYIAIGYALSGNIVRLFMDTPVPLRGKPAVKITGFQILSNKSMRAQITSINVLWPPAQNKIELQAEVSSGQITPGDIVFLESYGGSTLIIDANL